MRLAFFCFCVVSLFAAEVAANEKIIKVVVNNDAEISFLTDRQLKRLFTLRQQHWPNGKPVRLIVLASQDPIHQSVTKSHLGMFPYQLERMWNKLAYSGVSELPTKVSNEGEMLEMVSKVSGAIGYVSSDAKISSLEYRVVQVTLKEAE